MDKYRVLRYGHAHWMQGALGGMCVGVGVGVCVCVCSKSGGAGKEC